MNKQLALFFTISSILTSVVVDASTYSKICSFTVGSTSSCDNTLRHSDQLVNFSHTMTDRINVPSAYKIKFTGTTWRKGTISRGAPIYQSYWIMDNKNNNMIYYTDDYNGKYLNDYSSIMISTQVTSDYYRLLIKTQLRHLL